MVAVHRRPHALLQSLIAADPVERPAAAEVVRGVRHFRCRRRLLKMVWALSAASAAIVWLGFSLAFIWHGKVHAEAGVAGLANSLNNCETTAEALKRQGAMAERRSAVLESSLTSSAHTIEQRDRRITELEHTLKELGKLPGPSPPPVVETAPSVSGAEILAKASNKWVELVSDDHRTWDSMGSLIQDQKLDDKKETDERVRSKLKEWRTRFEERKTKPWWIGARDVTPDIEKGSHPQSVRIEVIGHDRSEVIDFPVYQGEKGSPHDLYSFDWKPGDKIRVSIYGPSRKLLGVNYWWAPELAAETLSGPVTLWQLNKHRVEIKDSGTAVEFEIEDCPGPPPQHRIDPKKTVEAIGSQLSEGK